MSLLKQADVVRTPCPACGAAEARELPACTALIRPAFRGSRVVRCTACSLTHVHPIPPDTEEAYEEDYFRAYANERIALPAEALPERYQQRFRRLSRGASTGTLLEIGCGTGSFLNLARQQGWVVSGVDVSRYGAEQVRQRYGIDVIHGTLEQARFPDSSFDVAHMSHVLEHLRDPVAGLGEVRRVLKPGGLLGVEVPNEFENLGTRILSMVGLPRPYPVPSTHLWFFSPATLARATTDAGLSVVSLRTFRDTDEAKPLRRVLKQAAARVESPLGKGPLIEMIAMKPHANGAPSRVHPG